MGYLETEIAKLNRRIERIKENPDPKQLKANALLYEIQRDKCQRQLDALNEGKPLAYSLGLDFVLEAMGATTFNIISASDRVGKKAASYFQTIRAAGYPSTICDRFQMSLGLILSGDAPKPDLVASYQSCDVETLVHMSAAYHWNVPYYFVDFRPNTGISLDHMVNQLREMIDYFEKNVPGVKYDEERLAEMLEQRKEGRRYLHEVGQLLKTRPSPITGRDAFRIIHPRLAKEPRGLEYLKALRDEIKDRVERGYSPVPNEKLRILWAVTGPYFIDVFKILERHDASMPIFLWSNVPEEYGLTDRDLWDVDVYLGRPATPLEEAANTVFSTWFGPSERWVREVVQHCEQLGIDGIVYYQLSGCPSCRSMARMVADAAEERLGIPMLQLEGWMLDEEKFDPALAEEKLEEFLSICEARTAAQVAG